MIEILSHSPEETIKVGETIGNLLRPGDVVVIVGELGTGKTVLVKGISKGIEVRELITSPSFAILHHYTGKLPVYHFDLYRLDSVSLLQDTGWEDYLEGDGVVLIEWGEKVVNLLTIPYLKIGITYVDNGESKENWRKLIITASDGNFSEVFSALHPFSARE